MRYSRYVIMEIMSIRLRGLDVQKNAMGEIDNRSASNYLRVRANFLNHFNTSQLFESIKASGVLKAVKNNGVPAKDKGDTGPTVINEYCLEAISTAL